MDKAQALTLNSAGRLHAFCGKMAAGKSTLAASISEELNGIRLCEDDLLLSLYPEKVIDVPTYAHYSHLIKQALTSHIVSLLQRKLSVVLDFPANTREQRKWFLSMAHEAGVTCALHVIECNDELCLVRLKKRAREHPERRATDTVEMFNAISRFYEAPIAEEGFNILKNAG